MKHRFFTIPALHLQPAEDELNAFIAGHRVVQVEKQFVVDGANSYWSLCVTWTEQAAPLKEKGARARRVDYKELLNDDDFMLFSRLRELRGRLAEAQGVPAYHVFTNEQLAAMAQKRVSSRTALAEIDGIGKARIEKYSQAFLELIAAEGGADEADAD